MSTASMKPGGIYAAPGGPGPHRSLRYTGLVLYARAEVGGAVGGKEH